MSQAEFDETKKTLGGRDKSNGNGKVEAVAPAVHDLSSEIELMFKAAEHQGACYVTEGLKGEYRRATSHLMHGME